MEKYIIEAEQFAMSRLSDALPKMTKRQLQCYILKILGFNQTQSGKVLGIDQRTVSEHLGNVWDKIGKTR